MTLAEVAYVLGPLLVSAAGLLVAAVGIAALLRLHFAAIETPPPPPCEMRRAASIARIDDFRKRRFLEPPDSAA